MFCPNCGNEINDNSKYCPKCGIEIKKITRVEIIKHFGLLKTLSLLIIFIIFSFLLIKFFFLNGKYEELYVYLDLKKNPYKYSYNYLISKELIKEDYNKKNSIYKQIENIDSLYREQSDNKSQTIIKYIDSFYDYYRSILNDDYENIKEIKFEIKDLENYKEIQNLASNIILLFPQIENFNELKNNLELKKLIKEQLKKQYNVSVDLNEINFYNISEFDDFFIDFSDINDEDKFKNIENITILRKELENKSSNKEKYEFLIKKLLPEYRKLFYTNITDCTGKQFITKTTKNGTKYIYKIKPMRGGNTQYWEILEIKDNNNFLQNSINSSEKQINKIKQDIKQLFI